MSDLGYGCLATLMGRYYAMDRDKRYERIKLAYEGMTQGKGEKTNVDGLIKVVEFAPFCLPSNLVKMIILVVLVARP